MLIAFCSIVQGQSAPLNLSLYTVQYKAGTGREQEIVRYDFKNGEYVSKEIILSLPIDDFLFIDEEQQIYQKRFIISRSGGIFDIQTRQVLGDGRGQFVDVVGNDVIVGENKFMRGEFYAFNLETKKYRELPKGNIFEIKSRWINSRQGKLSPNKKRFAIWKTEGSNREIQFHEVKNWKSIGGKAYKAYFFASCSLRCSGGINVPFVWLDDENILTQKQNGEIVSVNINGKAERIVTIPIEKLPDSLPYINKDEYGNISYHIGGTRYAINVKNKSYTKNNLILGNGFESVAGEDYWNEYFYNGKSIGSIWSHSPVSYKGFLVIDYAKEGQNLGYTDGIKVWNDIKKDWITIEVNWGVNIIGWLEEKE